MLKQEITSALTRLMKKQDKVSVNTIRLILAVIKDKEISMRSNGSSNEITDNEIFLLLRNMINQRQDSIILYKHGKREELAKQENNEIKIIEQFLSKQLNNNEIESACKEAVSNSAVNVPGDIDKIMNELKHKFLGRIDMTKARTHIKKLLSDNIK